MVTDRLSRSVVCEMLSKELLETSGLPIAFAAWMPSSRKDFDLVIVGQPGSRLSQTLAPLLQRLVSVRPRLVGFGSFRQQIALCSHNGLPLHVIAYQDQVVAEATEAPLLLKKIGLFAQPYIRGQIQQDWASLALPPLSSRLQRYRQLLAETYVLLEIGAAADDLIRREAAHKLAYVARHVVEEVLHSVYRVGLTDLLDLQRVLQKARKYEVPDALVGAMQPARFGRSALRSAYVVVDDWISVHASR